MSTKLDHIVIAAPNLQELIDRFAQLTGVTPIPGGRHDVGSANALVPLAGPVGSYIELIGPDPEAEKVSVDNFALASSTDPEPHVAAWCIRPESLDELAELYKGVGINPHDVEDMSRHTPEGTTLNWRLVPPSRGAEYAPIPFAIDWLDSPHPSTIDTPLINIVEFVVTGAERLPDELHESFSSELLNVIRFQEGAEGLSLKLSTPNGTVDMSELAFPS